MEITKEQIQEIDNRLEKNGVKYWDIRIELLDHVVTDVEVRITKGEIFKEAVQNSFISLGWNGSFKDITRYRLLDINKIIRKQYFNQVKQFFLSVKYLLGIVLLIATYFLFFLNTNDKSFGIISIIILLLPVCYSILNHLYLFSTSKKSGYLLYSSFYIVFSFLFLNIFIQLFYQKGFILSSVETKKIVLFIVVILNSIFSLAGILLHLRISEKIKMIKNKLLSL
tara:strand:+ start:15941 stop:16615 length:675 start_codon:yes stop_codon:yes gene_type:complete